MYKRQIQSILQKQLGYEYRESLSEGKFSDVLLFEMPPGEITAGKIVCEDQIKENELQFWPLLEHKNVVKLTKTILMPELNTCCFLMNRQFMALEKIVRKGWLQDDENNIFDIKRWLLDSLSGVEYLHRHNMCHLNIDANNILVSYDSTAKLGGLRFISSSTQPISECGHDFPYYPPELCYSRGEDVLVDPLGVDLWSLGMLTLRLFTNNILKEELGNNLTPWSKDIYKKIFREVKDLQWHIKKSFPDMDLSPLDLKRLKNFIQMFLSLKPEDRPSAEQAKMHKFLCSGLYMPKPDTVWKKKTSCVTIEMIVEQHNTLENVKGRCEGRAEADNLKPPLRPHDNHRFINLSTSSQANVVLDNLDNCSDKNAAVTLETLHKVEEKSLVVRSADNLVEWDRVETPGFEDCIRTTNLENFEVSRSGVEERQRIVKGCHREKPDETVYINFVHHGTPHDAQHQETFFVIEFRKCVLLHNDINRHMFTPALPETYNTIHSLSD